MCPNSPYFGSTDADYGSDESRLGVDIDCNGNSGRYVSIVKTEADPGATSFDICTFGVMASCDCSNLEAVFYTNDDKYPKNQSVLQGEKLRLILDAPHYSVTDAVSSSACYRVQQDCPMLMGLNAELTFGGDQTDFMRVVDQDYRSLIYFMPSMDTYPGDYDLLLEWYNKYDPEQRIFHTATVRITVEEHFED
jgi:hypothetical protein